MLKLIKINLIDKRESEKRVQHYYEGGLGEFVNHLDGKRKPLFEIPIQIEGEKERTFGDYEPIQLKIIKILCHKF